MSARKYEFAPNAKLYTSVDELFQIEELDFVDILIPPQYHAEICAKAKSKNLHIICQKPICYNLHDAKQLVNAMEDHDKLFAIHENHRFRSWFQNVIEKHQQGFFGRVLYVRWFQHNPFDPSVTYKLKMDPGILLEHGTHLVDMARALIGEPERVYARLNHLNPIITGESLAYLVFEYPESTAIIEVAWKPGGFQQAGFVIEGEEGEAYFSGSMVRSENSEFQISKGKNIVL